MNRNVLTATSMIIALALSLTLLDVLFEKRVAALNEDLGTRLDLILASHKESIKAIAQAIGPIDSRTKQFDLLSRNGGDTVTTYGSKFSSAEDHCEGTIAEGFLVGELNVTTEVEVFKSYSVGSFMTFPTTPSFKLKATHIPSILSHHGREKDLLQIMKGCIKKHISSGGTPFIVDAGANHGTYALFAATLGADVVAVEPQKSLVGNMVESIERNGLQTKIRIFNNAVLDRHTGVHIAPGDNGRDGGVATVHPGGQICTVTLDDLIRRRTVAFLKIDVEGNDLKAMRSAKQAYRGRLVNNVLVEFGPPQRWQDVTQETEDDGIQTLVEMHKHGFTTFLAPSQCAEAANNLLSMPIITFHGVKLARVAPRQFRELVHIMGETNTECYMLWTLVIP